MQCCHVTFVEQERHFQAVSACVLQFICLCPFKHCFTLSNDRMRPEAPDHPLSHETRDVKNPPATVEGPSESLFWQLLWSEALWEKKSNKIQKLFRESRRAGGDLFHIAPWWRVPSPPM